MSQEPTKEYIMMENLFAEHKKRRDEIKRENIAAIEENVERLFYQTDDLYPKEPDQTQQECLIIELRETTKKNPLFYKLYLNLFPKQKRKEVFKIKPDKKTIVFNPKISDSLCPKNKINDMPLRKLLSNIESLAAKKIEEAEKIVEISYRTNTAHPEESDQTQQECLVLTFKTKPKFINFYKLYLESFPDKKRKEVFKVNNSEKTIVFNPKISDDICPEKNIKSMPLRELICNIESLKKKAVKEVEKETEVQSKKSAVERKPTLFKKKSFKEEEKEEKLSVSPSLPEKPDLTRDDSFYETKSFKEQEEEQKKKSPAVSYIQPKITFFSQYNRMEQPGTIIKKQRPLRKNRSPRIKKLCQNFEGK
jgi:hypothetical protein